MRVGPEFGHIWRNNAGLTRHIHTIQRTSLPQSVKRADQSVDQRRIMHGRWGKAQPFGAARHGGKVDGLRIDPVIP